MGTNETPSAYKDLTPQSLGDMRAELRRPLVKPNDFPHNGDMNPWIQSVEARLGQLHGDITGLRGEFQGLRGEVRSNLIWVLSAFGAGFLALLTKISGLW
jgi:hypothetical protein